MTKVTVLHFASPFAFSLPAPVPPARRPGAAREEAAAMAVAPRPSTKDGPSVVFAADTVLPNSAAATEGAGLAGSAYDAVVRRYREQGSAADADPAPFTDGDAASD